MAPRRPRGLLKLARSHGILTEYRDAAGHQRPASTRTLRALLRALRVPEPPGAQRAREPDRALPAPSTATGPTLRRRTPGRAGRPE
ncbi:MAG: hypothetical protein ACREC5_08425, partial [Thermoplasmata archaeon]